MRKTVMTAAQTAVLMAILTLISKLIGFVREMVMANFFGTTYITDAYVMSFTILSAIFGGFIAAVTTSYIPIFSRVTEHEGQKKGNQFTSETINLLLIITVSLSLLGIIFADQVIVICASGFSGATAKLASFFIRVLFSYVIFYSVAGVLESYLQYKGVFLPQIIGGYLISICTIIAIIISAYTSHYYLAFGMLIGYFLRLLVMIAIAKNNSFKYTFTHNLNNALKKIYPLAVPAFIGSYMLYINMFIDKTLASRLTEGSIAALNYASLLNNMIMGVTVSILATIIYPKLAQANSLKQYDRFNDIVGAGITIVAMIVLPCSLGAMVYSNQLIQAVYERGVFDSMATAMTSSAFFFYAAGLLFMSTNDLIIRIYYSIHDMKTPMIFSGIGVILNIILNFILIRSMAHNGLALATSIASFCTTVMLSIGLKRKYSYINIFKSKNKFLKVIIASAISVGISYLCYIQMDMQLYKIYSSHIVQLLISVVIAGLIYIILLIFFKVEEINLMKQIIKRTKKQ